ncbi:hypothetical protein FPZ24_11650 [Sphingomonas panacisoli]|uniref:O-antigen ligase-related domain-containing protein n=1 Tax=Sphingomonas panacisoli TaxID=1813879 RepID=A0A5B8LKF0_9SPHN|nr:O-antigen ligase family protein [Sphingomonas panacisoli]QDZ08054.1 hypothetical protein FPZ24_11650 [Sphingomonas panacisoli]
MTLVIFFLVLLSFPLILGLLKSYPHRRVWAFTVLGALLFLGDEIRLEGFIIGWPGWFGTVRGIAISPADALALALVMTRRPVRGNLPFWGVFAVYAVALTVSMMPASVPMASVFAVWQFARMLLLFSAIGGECFRPDLRQGLLNGCGLGLMVQAGFVIWQKLHGVVQAPGTMAHQNILGMLTEVSLLLLLASLLSGSRSKLQMAGIVAALIIIAGGGSRGALVLAGSGVVILMILSLARRVTPTKMTIIGAGVLALAVAAPFSLMTLNHRFGGKSVITQEDERNSFEKAAKAMAANHPFGVGANQFVLVSNRDGYAARAGVPWQVNDRSMPVHNAYLLARAETGLFGELAFILMLVLPAVRGLWFAFTNKRSPGGEIVLGAGVAMALNVVHNNFEFAAFTYNVLALLMVCMALIGGEIRAARNAGRPAPKPKAPVRPINTMSRPAVS